MAEKLYEILEPIEIVYQAPNKETGLSGVVAEIYLPNGQKDSSFPDVSLTELDGKGVYVGTFTPDEQGEWKAICHKSNGDGQVVKRYSVGGYSVNSVGNAVADVGLGVDALETTLTGVDTQLDNVEGKVDDINTKVSALDTPPMVS